MSGRIRRMLRTVPTGRVRHGELRNLAMSPARSSARSPAQALVRRLLSRHLGEPAGSVALLTPGRLIDAQLLGDMAHTISKGEAGGGWLIIGDGLAGETDPAATLKAMLAATGLDEIHDILVVLPGTALMPDDEAAVPRRWLYSRVSAERLAAETFTSMRTTVDVLGNVLVATSELLGLAADELWTDELAIDDPQYPIVVAIKATMRP